MTLDDLITKLIEIRESGVPGAAEVLRYVPGDDENYRDTEDPISTVLVQEYIYINHLPDVVMS